MNEFEDQDDLLEHARHANKVERRLNSRGHECAICRVYNPLLLQAIQVAEPDGTHTDDWLCHNHAKLLGSMNKKLFSSSEDDEVAGDKQAVYFPRILVHSYHLEFELQFIGASHAIVYEDLTFPPEINLDIQLFAELKSKIWRWMRLDPHSPSSDCKCCFCGEARPIMLDVHHVDRQRNSERAIFVCVNHHTLITYYQEHDQLDERKIRSEKLRARRAETIGEGILKRVEGEFICASDKHMEEREDLADALIENVRMPVEDAEDDQQFWP